MGGSQSVAGHIAHPVGWRHRLKRVESNEEKGQCGMCSDTVEVTAPAYRCGRCLFVLHESCHSFPKKIRHHFAHPEHGHPLELSKTHLLQNLVCNICARSFDAGSFVYGCKQCHSFYGHPTCCKLREVKLPGRFHHHTLTLRAPPTTWQGHERRCLNGAGTGRCQNARRLPNDYSAWSYQCNDCRVELCLACQLPGGGGAHTHQRNLCSCDCVQNAVHWMGTTVGTFFGAMFKSCAGLPVQPPQSQARAVSQQ